MIKRMKKVLQRFPPEVSIHWRYLRQDHRKTYGKYPYATICRYMVKNIGDLVLDQWK